MNADEIKEKSIAILALGHPAILETTATTTGSPASVTIGGLRSVNIDDENVEFIFSGGKSVFAGHEEVISLESGREHYVNSRG